MTTFKRYSSLFTILFMKIYQNYSLKKLNTFGIDVNARFYCVVRKLGGLKTVLKWQQEHPELPVLFLGGGSNVLFINDYPGLVVQVGLKGLHRWKALFAD